VTTLARVRAVDRRDHDHRRQREVGDQQRQRAEGRRLEAIDDRQDQPRRRLLHPRDQQRGKDRGQKPGSEEERRGRIRTVRLFVDEQRQGDDPHPIAHLVDRVRRQQPPEKRFSQRRSEPLITHGYAPVYLVYAQVFLQLHKFPQTCATTSLSLLEVLFMRCTRLWASTMERGIEMGYRNG
jgi:hypothetical protein